MNKDTLGDRMKMYEAVSNQTLTHRMPVFIRVDGKAFHTFTRGCKKPYDQDIIDAMVYAANQTSKIMQGFKLAYIQSDEATFMLLDTDSLEAQPWYGNEINKLVSITASSFTAHFNIFWQNLKAHKNLNYLDPKPAMFDARAFNVPLDDAPNNFIWRQRDWERNSIQMLGRANFSQKQLQGQKIPDIHLMLLNIGVDPDERTDQIKNGTFIERDGTITHNRETYETLADRF